MREIAKLFLLLLPSSWLCFLGWVCWFSRKLLHLPPSLTPCTPCWHPGSPSFSYGMDVWLLNAAQGRAAQRDCPFWWLSELGKIKHTSLCPQSLTWVQHTAVSMFIARRASSNQTRSQMRSGNLPDVCQKGLWNGYNRLCSSAPRKALQATQENSLQVCFTEEWQALFMHFLPFCSSLSSCIQHSSLRYPLGCFPPRLLMMLMVKPHDRWCLDVSLLMAKKRV